MLNLTKNSIPVALALRVIDRQVPVDCWNDNPKYKKFLPSQVFNQHLAILDDGSADFVYFSTNTPISTKYASDIKQVVFFSQKEDWAAICDVDLEAEPFDFVPLDADDINQPQPWANMPAKTWIKIKSYKQVMLEDLKSYKLINQSTFHNCETLYDLLTRSSRFNSAYIAIE